MFCFPVETFTKQFADKILTQEGLMSAYSTAQKPVTQVHPKRVQFKEGDRVSIQAKVPKKHNSNHMLEDVEGTIVDVAPYGGNGGLSMKNGEWCVDQEPLYKIKFDRVIHIIAVGDVDEAIGFNTSLMKKIK